MTNFKNNYQQFLKYLKNQLSSTERYDFEKSTQKNAFEQEALEGFENVNTADIEKDILLLNKQIKNKTSIGSDSKLFRFYTISIAASLILLFGVGLHFLTKEAPVNVVYDNDLNKEELPSVKLEKPKDSIHTEIVFEETDITTKENVQDLNIENNSPLNKEIKIDKKVTSKSTPLNTTDIIESTDLEETEHLTPNTPKETILLSNTEKIEQKTDSLNRSIIEGIVSADELPLPGVNIKIKGTDIGAISDFDGKYTLRVKDGDTLEFSSLGFKTKETLASHNLKISLEENLETLDEVAVIGYGTTVPNKEKKKIKQNKTRKSKKSKVRIFRLKRAIGVKKQKALKKSLSLSDSTNIDSTKTNTKSTSPNTIEDFGKWIDLKLNSSLFEPRKLYHFEISFEINETQQLDNLKFHSTNEHIIQNELRRVLLSAPSWILEVFNDRETFERINMELQVIF